MAGEIAPEELVGEEELDVAVDEAVALLTTFAQLTFEGVLAELDKVKSEHCQRQGKKVQGSGSNNGI